MVCQTDLNSVVLMQAEEGVRWWAGGGGATSQQPPPSGIKSEPRQRMKQNA